MANVHFPTAFTYLKGLLQRTIQNYEPLTNRISPQHWRVTGHHIAELKQMVKDMRDFTEITDDERLRVAEFLDPEFRVGEQVTVIRDDDTELKDRIQAMFLTYPLNSYHRNLIGGMYCHKPVEISFNGLDIRYERGEEFPVYSIPYNRLIELLVDGSITPNVPTEDEPSKSNPQDEIPDQYQQETGKSSTMRYKDVGTIWTDDYVEWLENRVDTLSKRKA